MAANFWLHPIIGLVNGVIVPDFITVHWQGPIPTSLGKTCYDAFVPVITRMVNLSLEDSVVSSGWKVGLILPSLILQNLHLVFCNFRPVSNLPYVTKIAEKPVFDHCSINTLMSSH